MDEWERIAEEGRDVSEMEATPGWKHIASRLQAELSETRTSLKSIETEGRSPADVGADYIAAIQRIAGLERVFQIMRGMKEDGKRAQQEHE